MFDDFLLGVVVSSSLMAAAFFCKFWVKTKDSLFFGFGAAFFIEGCNRVAFLFVDSTAESNVWIFAVRLLSYLIILGTIAHKNRRRTTN
jgi:hypothetical protein